jgi:hypothetical protein
VYGETESRRIADELSREIVSERVDTIETMDRWSLDDIRAATSAYVSRLPSDLQEVVIVKDQRNRLDITIPLESEDYPLGCTLHVNINDSDDEQPDGGVHLLVAPPVSLSMSEALAWAARLNGADPASIDEGSVVTRTTPWLFGAWRVLTDSQDSPHLAFTGLVPDRYRHYVCLTDCIDGVLKEVSLYWEKQRLHDEFNATIEWGMGDV